MPSSQQALSVALVGCGAVSQQFYGPSLAYLEQEGLLKLETLIDPNQTARGALSERFPNAVHAKDIEDLREGDIDLAVIASPPKFHCSQTLQAFQKGCHALCEKPMAYSSEEAEQMIQASKRFGKLLAVGHYKRFFPAAQQIKQIIKHQSFGPLLRFDIQEGGKFGWPAASDSFFRKEITPGGILLDIGVHVLDLLIWWLGEPSSITYRDDNLGGLEANAKLEIEYPDNSKGSVFLTREWKTPMSYTFQFEKATVVYKVNDSNGLSIRLAGSDAHLSGSLKSFKKFGELELPDAPLQTNAASFIRQLENVCLSINGKADLMTDGFEGKAPLDLIEKCYANRQTVAMPWLSDEENQSLASQN